MKKEKLFPILILTPFFVFFVIFKLFPIVFTFSRSIFDVSGGKSNYNFFNNYVAVFSDKMLLKAILNTLIIFIVYIFMKIPLILLFGVLINSMTKMKKIYLKTLYLPTLVGMFAYAIIYRYLFNYDGIINSIIYFIFKIKVNWLGNSLAAQSVVAMALLWSSFGISLIMVINAIKTIPIERFEYAKLEGAGIINTILKVVMPAIKPLIVSIVILSLVEVVGLVDVPMNLTAGAPENSTVTLGYYILIQAFDFWDFSYAATLGIMMFISIMVPLLIQKKKVELYEVF